MFNEAPSTVKGDRAGTDIQSKSGFVNVVKVCVQNPSTSGGARVTVDDRDLHAHPDNKDSSGIGVASRAWGSEPVRRHPFVDPQVAAPYALHAVSCDRCPSDKVKKCTQLSGVESPYSRMRIRATR